MREIRVLQFVNILDRGGTESFIFNNLEKMDHSKVNFDFLLTRDMEEPREADLVKYECQKITIVPNGNNKIERYVDLYKKLMNFFKKCDYKIIHFESNPPGIMSTASTLAARRAGIPVRILHSHGGGGEKVSFSRIRPIITRICRYINVKSCNYYMAPSNSSAVYGFGRKVSRSKRCVIIKNAIDVQKFLFDSNRREFYRRLLNIDNDTVILGTVGRISEVKNQEFMIDIFYEYVKYNTNARLILIGGAVETEKSIDEKLKKKVHSLGLEDKVVFFGECTDVPGILCALDGFLFTSRTEALGIAAIEAQVNGLPVFVAEDGIPREVQITNNVIWHSLKQTPKTWALSIDKKMKCILNRIIDLNDGNIKGVDVRVTSKRLESIYSGLQKSLQGV